MTSLIASALYYYWYMYNNMLHVCTLLYSAIQHKVSKLEPLTGTQYPNEILSECMF